MTSHQVTSKIIKEIGYDPSTNTMEIVFSTGSKYRYKDVPGKVWDDFRGAKSIGKHFHENIRGNFDATKL